MAGTRSTDGVDDERRERRDTKAALESVQAIARVRNALDERKAGSPMMDGNGWMDGKTRIRNGNGNGNGK